MRTLTIQREKSFVGCLQPYQFYIEDPVSPELEINGKPCRKLGALKNGQQQTFEIGGEPVRIYAIADKLSKEYCNDYFDVPAGQEDLIIRGKIHYNPLAGNPFYFEKELDEEAQKHRKKSKKKSGWIMVIAVFVGLVVGFTISSISNAERPETFQYDTMQVTLTNQFRQKQFAGFTVCYDSRDVAVLVTQVKFAEVEGLEALSVEEYIAVLVENNAYPSKAYTLDSLEYFEYQWENPDDGVTYHYFCPLYKTADSFWIVQFCTAQNKLEQYWDSMVSWAKSVTFTSRT